MILTVINRRCCSANQYSIVHACSLDLVPDIVDRDVKLSA